MSAPAETPVGQPTTAAQRDALDRILASGVLDRAPNLALMLRYVCEQAFEGRTADIKEYNIAVEALGRDPGFDQKKDAIVRVEAHKLRKRLAEYYRSRGAHDPVEVLLPPGTYVPRFTIRPTGEPAPAAPETAEPAPLPTVPADHVPEPLPVQVLVAVNVPEKRAALTASSVERARLRLVAGVAVGLILVASLGTLMVVKRQAGTESAPVMAPPGPTLPVHAAQPGLRFVTGSQAPGFLDQDGLLWAPDRYYSGGTIVSSPARPIARTSHADLYLTRREGDFSYTIPLSPGVYELRLHFAETVFGEGNIAGGGESSRVFLVTANRSPLPMGDVLSEAGGPNTANVRVVKDVRPAEDGFLHLEFARVKDHGFVNAIELVPGLPGQMHPVRIAARPTGFVTSAGTRWSSDRYVVGGQAITRQEPVQGAENQDVFRGERFGHFDYDIPVAPNGRYSVTLYFAERWFGPTRPGGGGEGSRVFDVYCNGRTLLRAFDVYKAAGGSERALQKTFRGLEPNALGKLRLMFVPVRNYAMINAIEVVDEGR
ncbi:MAG TPA: malectin domain-containing carbohydrate-binding protein [Bryobacteraceae bacterium]|nr:malectin domain-containing carbohydrate-binding protein [Bryobacteraceae bacterium]